MSSDILEILILAFIAAAIAYKFYAILGENHGINPDDMAVRSNATAQQAEAPTNNPDLDRVHDKTLIAEQFHVTYDAILTRYPDFSLAKFLQGANIALEMIVKAYTSDDRATLRSLTDDKTYADFESAMQERVVKKQRLVTSIIKIEPLVIDDLILRNSCVDIKIKYVSEQTNILYDQAGNIIEGSPNQSEQVTDIWTYQRDINSRDPNWRLVDTGY